MNLHNSSCIFKNNTENHLTFDQQLLGLTLRVNPWLWNPAQNYHSNHRSHTLLSYLADLHHLNIQIYNSDTYRSYWEFDIELLKLSKHSCQSTCACNQYVNKHFRHSTPAWYSTHHWFSFSILHFVI